MIGKPSNPHEVVFAVVVATHNRQRMFQQMMKQVGETILPKGLEPKQTCLVVIGDQPKYATHPVLQNCKWPGYKDIVPPVEKHLGCDRTIMRAFGYVIRNYPQALWIANVEDDSNVNKNWLQVLWDMKGRAPNVGGWTVYNSVNHRAIGKRHAVETPDSSVAYDLLHKQTVGGLGLMLKKDVAFKLSRYINKHGLVNGGWDWTLCELMKDKMPPFAASSPSFIQHLGRSGTHTEKGDPNWDQAKDFVGI